MDCFVHWPPLFTLHLDRFVPRDDGKEAMCVVKK